MTLDLQRESRHDDMRAGEEEVHVGLRGLSKSYGGVHAVRDVSFSIMPGSIHALVGENGAGKSTVSKLIAGVTSPDFGELVVDGESVTFSSPRQALAAGIAMIDQELAMVASRSVIDNVFLGMESSRGGLLRAADQRRRFAALLERTGFEIDGDTQVGALRVAVQQQVEILRALAREARFVILDEPTARLSQVEAEHLYRIIRTLRDSGTTILYISHFLEEVLDIADTVTIMRDGMHVRTGPTSAETQASLVAGMLGREVDVSFPERPVFDADAAPCLEVDHLSIDGVFSDISLSVRPGEILGVAGLIGSGRTEVLRALVGADKVDSGCVRVEGDEVSFRSPADAIRSGIVMLPESRKDEGLVMNRSIAENVVLANLQQVSRWGFLRGSRERREVRDMVASLDVRAPDPSVRVDSLSGGNQQKVLFAKCLLRTPRVLLIDEPTRGVDVGAKRAIYELIISLAVQGMTIIVVSSELEEVRGLAHRILVMRRGHLAADLPAEQASETAILSAAFGAEVAS